MLERLAITRLHATRVGPVAARVLRAGARGMVGAAFKRSFYVSLDGGWVCVGPSRLGAGPLNLLCDQWYVGQLSSAVLQIGDIASIENGVLRAGSLTILLAAAQTWRPQPVRAWSKGSLWRGLAAFDAALPTTLPQEGLARLLHAAGDESTLILTAARPSIHYLTQLLQAAADGHFGHIDAEQIAPLIGLGPGLTPSGDDYLGGILMALSLTSQIALRDRIWHALQPYMIQGTSDISRAHLTAAADGFGSAALHALLKTILTGASWGTYDPITSVTASGHTSGWDALAGAITVLRSMRLRCAS